MAKFYIKLLLSCLLLLSHCTIAPSEQTNTAPPDGAPSDRNLLTAKIYAKLFKERRKEHQLVIAQLLESSYEKNYNLLLLAYEQIFEIFIAQNRTLTSNQYEPARDGFPHTAEMQDAVSMTLENCCIAAESVLHFPEISNRIFRHSKRTHSWQATLNWCIEFVNALPQLTDESTVTLMELLQMEINPELRTENYVNPYYKKSQEESAIKKKSKKERKKLKKGPQLSVRVSDEL